VNVLAKNGISSTLKKLLDAVLGASRRAPPASATAWDSARKCTGAKDLIMAIGKPATPIDFRQSMVGRQLIWR